MSERFKEKPLDADKVTVVSHLSRQAELKEKRRLELLAELQKQKNEEREKVIAEVASFTPHKSYFSEKSYLFGK